MVNVRKRAGEEGEVECMSKRGDGRFCRGFAIYIMLSDVQWAHRTCIRMYYWIIKRLHIGESRFGLVESQKVANKRLFK